MHVSSSLECYQKLPCQKVEENRYRAITSYDINDLKMYRKKYINIFTADYHHAVGLWVIFKLFLLFSIFQFSTMRIYSEKKYF